MTPLRRQLTRAEGIAKVVKAYMRMIRPFKVFKENGLQNFFLHAAWPWSWTEHLGKHGLEKNQWLKAHGRSEQFATVVG